MKVLAGETVEKVTLLDTPMITTETHDTYCK